MTDKPSLTLVTQRAPDFTAPAVMPDNSINEKFNLLSYLQGKKGLILFFYPLDFTFVCPSEILAFDHRLDEFKARGFDILSVSVDSHFTHLAWKNTPVEKGGIGQVQFPMVADLTKEIARSYHALVNEAVSLRATFLIDADGIIRHQLVNDLPLGRNVDETLRLIDAWQFHQAHGEVCPAGWNKGRPGMKATAEGVAEYLSENAINL